MDLVSRSVKLLKIKKKSAFTREMGQPVLNVILDFGSGFGPRQKFKTLVAAEGKVTECVSLCVCLCVCLRVSVQSSDAQGDGDSVKTQRCGTRVLPQQTQVMISLVIFACSNNS